MAGGEVGPSAGSKLWIGTTATNPAGDVFTLVNEIVNYGEFGRVYQEITHQPVATGDTKKFKGAYNDGNITLQLGRAPSDAGQAAMKAALDSKFDYNFRVRLNDGSGSPANPTTMNFKGKVMSFTTNIGGANQVVGATCVIGISGSITETPAT